MPRTELKSVFSLAFNCFSQYVQPPNCGHKYRPRSSEWTRWHQSNSPTLAIVTVQPSSSSS